MKRTLAFLTSSIMLLLISCSTDFGDRSFGSSQAGISYPNVDPQLHEYFQDFEKEAMQRGISIDLIELEISGVIENIGEEGVAGSCQFGNHIAHVTIDKSFWNLASTSIKEYVVFHELGHCVLERGHLEVTNSDGECQSIMASGTTDCIVNYNNSRRDRMIDELFGV